MPVDARNGPSIQFPEQNPGQRFDNRGGRSLEDVGDPDSQTAALEPDRAIGVGVTAEFDLNLGERRPRLQRAEHARIDFGRSFK